MNAIISILEKVMDFCYGICGNYGFAVILFTVFSKVILLPLAVWLHKNGIKVVKMTPELNMIKAKYFGASLIPLTVQILILMGLIAVIRKGIGNPDINMNFFGLDLSLIPVQEKGLLLLAPVIAGLSSFILCVAQNRINPLQAEQSMQDAVAALEAGMELDVVTIDLENSWTALKEITGKAGREDLLDEIFSRFCLGK